MPNPLAVTLTVRDWAGDTQTLEVSHDLWTTVADVAQYVESGEAYPLIEYTGTAITLPPETVRKLGESLVGVWKRTTPEQHEYLKRGQLLALTRFVNTTFGSMNVSAPAERPAEATV